jgi:hypothetical protein
MFIDSSGTLGHEHARDLRRTADAYRGHRHHPLHALREFVGRGQLGPVDNYRTR